MSETTFACGVIEAYYAGPGGKTKKSHPKCNEYAAGYKLGRSWLKSGQEFNRDLTKFWLRFRLEEK